jgi:HEAT repeat protein
VTLTDVLRKDKKAAPEVSCQLTPEDLQLIVQALNDPDRTIRVYAGEFFYDLGDPRVMPLALAAARDEQTTPNGLYLDLFVIKGAYHRLSPSEQ